jgi:RimJ/RimL family protein N-acetyltransferase
VSEDASPLGEPVDWTPARPPVRGVALRGDRVSLEPLDPARHADALAESADVDRVWAYLPYGPFAERAAFDDYLAALAASEDPLAYAIVDPAASAARGVCTFLRIEPAHGAIEIGHIWMSPALQRTREATEAIFLLARHAFEALGNRRLEWKCNALNAASCRAAERFGFTYEGTFRQAQVIKGRNRDTAWYSMLDREWPAIRAGFAAWLDDANFDAQGRQRARMADLRGRAANPPM